jgi:AcrR family transcriptional regulator
LPRQPDLGLEQRILDAASRLWARGGEKSLTMRAVAKAAGTTTPTVYERYRDRDDILRAIRWQTRSELFAALTHTRTLRDAVRCYLEFALEHSFTFEVLFDGVGQPPSLHEPWPSFNLFRERVAEHLGGSPQKHTRLMLSLWALMHGTAMLIIRGQFQGPLRAQAIHSCLDTFEGILYAAGRRHGIPQSGPKWPATLILGEEERSRTGNGSAAGGKHRARKSSQH